MKLQRPVIGYTLGDQAGIGPEVIYGALPHCPAHAEYRLIGKKHEFPLGIPSTESAQVAAEHLELAAEALRTGEIDAVVTAPVCKETLHKVGFNFPGQTEFFATRMGISNYAMCLTGKHITTVLCTTHTALADVPNLLKTDEIVRVASLLADFLKRTGNHTPRIALAGLNPHNGEA
jgi:4-hydroxythreonine-4-phosphate dehydrogenase